MTNREQILLAAVCAIICASLGCSTSESRSAAHGTAAATISRKPTGKWIEHDGKSEMDGTPTVILGVQADNKISYWLGSSTPTLVFRCHEKKLDAYVVTGTAASVEAEGMNGHVVRLRFDAGHPSSERWEESSDHQALFATDPTSLEKRTERAKQLRFEFTPFNASPAIATFDVRGLRSLAPRLRAACK